MEKNGNKREKREKKVENWGEKQMKKCEKSEKQ